MLSISKRIRALRARRREITGRAFAWGWRCAPRLAGAAELGIDFSTGRVQRRVGRLGTPRGALVVAYIGHNDPYREWLGRAVGGACGTPQPGPVRRRSLAYASAGDVDVTVIELPAHRMRYFASHGWLIVPPVVNHVQLLTGSGAKANEHERRIGFRVRRLGLGVRFTRSPADLRSFYETMYLPTARGRHGSGAIIRSEGYFLPKLRKGWLILAEREGVDVAGLLVEPQPGSPNNLSWDIYGVRDGDYETTRDVARLTPLFAAIDWARRSGFRSVRWGGTLPLLDNGLVRRKLRWGTQIEVTPGYRFCLAVRLERDGSALRALLAAHPFVASSAAGPVGIRGDAETKFRRWPLGLQARYVPPEDDRTADETAFESGDRAAALRRLAIRLWDVYDSR